MFSSFLPDFFNTVAMEPKKENVKLIFDTYAQSYQEKFMNVDRYSESLESLSGFLKDKDSVLDIGCGPGNISRYLLEKHPNLQLLGIDLSPNMIELAGRNNPSANFQVLDCRNIELLSDSFDVIVCGFCLPYLSQKEVRSLIRKVSALLKPFGFFYLSTMESKKYRWQWIGPSEGGSQKLKTYFHTCAYLQELLREQGFTIKMTQRLEPPEKKVVSFTDLIIISQLQGNQ